jgi:hypothetical protein
MTPDPEGNPTMTKVSYFHSKGYRVSRTFDTPEAAREFIDANALVYPLPGVEVTETPA